MTHHYARREKANAEYASRMASADVVAEARAKALSLKSATFTTVSDAIDHGVRAYLLRAPTLQTDFLAACCPFVHASARSGGAPREDTR